MCKSPLHAFLAALPKCEHHLHLEGCLTPDMMFSLAAKNGIALPSSATDPAYTSPATLAERYRRFAGLEDFLAYHYRAMAVLTTRADFEALAWSYFAAAFRDGVRHAEVFFDPQSHTARGVPLAAVVDGYAAACRRARSELGMSARLIMCFLRHLPAPAGRECKYLYEKTLKTTLCLFWLLSLASRPGFRDTTWKSQEPTCIQSIQNRNS
jgi:adenosine deaminase